MKFPRIILAGTHSEVGKTTIALGIMLALKKRGLRVAPFKAGPDYIDPSYHTAASGAASRNLDSWLLSKNSVLELFQRQAKAADISIIEGAMGLYDGLANTENGSTAQLAKILASPVILIVNARSISRSAGALALGYKEFDKAIDIKGVILNNIGSASHYRNAKISIERNANIPVLGFLPRDKNLTLPQRHLGLVPAKERTLTNNFTNSLTGLVSKNIDLGGLLRIARLAGPLPVIKNRIFSNRPPYKEVTIAIAKDKAFNFYYQDNLDILKHYGAKLVEFSPISDKRLPPGIGGLYIGGGFPEIFASRLSRNTSLKGEIYKKAKDGMPVYAECAGLMYLVKRIVDFNNGAFAMVGIFNAQVTMGNRLNSLGYADTETLRDNILGSKGGKNRAHVFHWSRLEGLPTGGHYAYKLKKSSGDILYDGLIKWDVLASYAHLHFASNIDVVRNFIRSCQRYRSGK